MYQKGEKLVFTDEDAGDYILEYSRIHTYPLSTNLVQASRWQ